MSKCLWDLYTKTDPRDFKNFEEFKEIMGKDLISEEKEKKYIIQIKLPDKEELIFVPFEDKEKRTPKSGDFVFYEYNGKIQKTKVLEVYIDSIINPTVIDYSVKARYTKC